MRAGASSSDPRSPGRAEGAILLLGRQGAGKGLLGRLLASRLRRGFLSMGDVLRAEPRRGTALGLEIGRLIEAGDGVPPDTSYGLMAGVLATRRHDEPLVVDGIPRRAGETCRVRHLLGGEPCAVVVLDVPTPIAVARLRSRQSCRECGMPHGPDWPPFEGRCRSCRGAVDPRADDHDLEAIDRRMEVWGMEAREIIAYYASLGVVHRVAADAAVPDVLERVLAVVAIPSA
jgi:adenylate kinase